MKENKKSYFNKLNKIHVNNIFNEMNEPIKIKNIIINFETFQNEINNSEISNFIQNLYK